ncbi:MAG: BlaI/MecI/CopY family transcriptional regulator [Planctomycetia bacterium]
MARPKAKELTERELEVMHVFWDRGESTAADVRDALEARGRGLAYTTVATLVRILLDKQSLTQTGDDRPFKFTAARSYEDVSRSLLGDLVEKVFGGSRTKLLMQLFEDEKLTPAEQRRLKEILGETGGKPKA